VSTYNKNETLELEQVKNIDITCRWNKYTVRT